MIIAIDGPAGSGKSTTARAVAERLGFLYLDTGAMYRAVALHFIRNGASPSVETGESLLRDLRIALRPAPAGTQVHLGGEDVTGELRSGAVTRMSSRVSALAPVRRFLVAEQRRIVDERAGAGVVVEGRDIGTVVFPRAELKIFLTASPAVRAGRRAAELGGSSAGVDTDVVRREMERRDRDDATRAVSPLKAADDAVTIDTTRLSFEEQVDRIVALARARQDRD